MSEIKVNLENLSDAEQEQFMKLIEKANASASKVWKPKLWDVYYAIDPGGEITQITYDTDYDEDVLSMGNGFRTKAEAEFEVERRKILKRWRDLSIASGEAENKWNGKNNHWYCYCNTYYKTIGFDYLGSCNGENTYFASRESLENAIAEIGEENVKKYILRV